ncbi:MAG TPA: site-2 protease family protein [Gemmataceae bacterium]|nr:site-2 protease family protein [Gemmataceae bacterium]
MPLFRSGSLWLFRLLGIDVYVHWSWLLVAIFQVQFRPRVAEDGSSWLLPPYESAKWHALQYLALFGIVLLHEFGHALACRRLGGLADTIVLWPLGGIAFVRPPQRADALLWTAVAGPLVNVLLVPILGALVLLDAHYNGRALSSDLPLFLRAIFALNLLLFFNLIPVYPLDGGQILQGLLWMLIGRAESLMIVSIIGMLVGGGMMMLSCLILNPFLCILSAFVMFTASAGFRHGRLMSRLLSGPRRTEAACPSCKSAPLLGAYWTCNECRARFDIFEQRGRCPECGQLYRVTKCPDCYQEHLIEEWFPTLTHHTSAPLPPVPSPDRASE